MVERAATPGGKMREVAIGGARIDAGPTVFTLRCVFEEIFAAAGASLADHVTLEPVEILARHAWSANQRLDLYADLEPLGGRHRRFRRARRGRALPPFCRPGAAHLRNARSAVHPLAPQPSLAGLIKAPGSPTSGRSSRSRRCGARLGDYFHDPRLRQLFGRYATYCGSSPFLAPATLMLVAHVEQDGVWLVRGRHAPAGAGAGRPRRRARASRFAMATEVSEVVVAGGRAAGVGWRRASASTADAVIVNADVAAVSGGLLGRAVTRAARRRRARLALAVGHDLVDRSPRPRASRWSGTMCSSPRDYPAEFEDIFRRGRMPAAPTVYVCAQDRGDAATMPTARSGCSASSTHPPPATRHTFDAAEIERCANRTFGLLERCGLRVRRTPESTVVTTPADFDRLFPATGGALYGQASHGWRASFERPGARTRWRASIWRGAARIRGRACRWRHCRAGSRRPPAGGPGFDQPVAPRRLCLVVCRRAERRRPARPHPDRLHRQRVLALLRLRPAPRRRRPAAPLRAERRALWCGRQTLEP